MSQRNILLIIGAGFVAVVIILLLVISSYRNVQSKSQQQRAERLKKIFVSRYADYHKLIIDQETFKKIEPLYAEKYKTLLTNQATSQALGDITQLAGKGNLNLIQFNPGKIIRKKYYNILPVKIALIGKYRNITRFLEQLADQTYTVTIKNMSMTMRDPKQGDIHLYLILNLLYRDKSDQNASS